MKAFSAHRKVAQILTFFILLCSFSSLLWAQYEAPSKAYYQHLKHVNALNFTENTTVKLKGQWQFYPQQLLREPDPTQRSITVTLPASFKKIVGNNQSYGTFVGHFKIPDEFVGRRIAILVPNQASAYRMYLNGDLLLRLGEVSIDPAQQITEKSTRIAYLVPEQAYFTLSIQASSTQQLHGGLEGAMKIGIARTVNRHFQSYMMSIAMVCGAVLGLGLFTILFSLFKGSVARNSKSIFMFGVFIIFLALHNLFSAPHAYTLFTTINWLWGTRLEYLWSLAAIGFFLTYMHWLNTQYLVKPIYVVAMCIISANVLTVLFTAPEIFERLALYSFALSWIVLANFIYGFRKTLMDGAPYSRLNLFAVAFLCVTFVNDFFVMMDWIEFIHLSFISTSVYALLVMFQQSRNYAFQTFHTEQLNAELSALNDSLEHKVKARTQQLNELNSKLEIQIRTDALTGAYNRRALNEEIQQAFDNLQQQQQGSVMFAMLDVDYFKQYNDHYGHLKGDEVLKHLVQILLLSLPSAAFVARYGGEEFAILLQGFSEPAALEYVQQALAAVRAAQLPHENRLDDKKIISLSVGVAYMSAALPAHFHDIHAMMKAADQQLYRAKQAGRDQLCYAALSE